MRAKIRFLTCLSFLPAFALWCFCEAAATSKWSLVRWVDDGDTVVLADRARVRYIGINAPEVAHEDMSAEKFGPEAGAFNRKLVYHKKVRLELDRQRHDQYGRLLAYVFLEDGTFVNAEMVRGGYAYYVFRRPNAKYDQLLLRLQREAMAKRVGLWKALRDRRDTYIGNRNSRRLHRATCNFGKTTSPKNRTLFKTRYAAFWAGYSPC
ncbi:MAG: thermonuclease family protein, partial [Desulfobacterales bacterium]|nr:thermonuclease family protein [Desulfobacterales bacterium]